MPKKFMLAVAIAAVSIVAFLTFQSGTNPTKVEKACCKNATQPCDKKDQKKVADDIIMENLSRQFINISPVGF